MRCTCLTALASAMLLGFAGSADALTLNQGDVRSIDFSLDTIPPEEIRFIDAIFAFGPDNGLASDEVLSLKVQNAGGAELFTTIIDFSDTVGGLIDDSAFAAETSEMVNPAFVTGTDYNYMLTVVSGSVNLTSFQLLFFGGTLAPGDDQSFPGAPFTRKPSPAIAWGNGVSDVPLPATAWLMLAGLGGLAALRRRTA